MLSIERPLNFPVDQFAVDHHEIVFTFFQVDLFLHFILTE